MTSVVGVMELPEKVILKRFRKYTHLPDGHDGEIRFARTYETIHPQRDKVTGVLNTGLTKEDEVRLEQALGLDKNTLNRYNKEWWGNFEIKVPKSGATLNPATNPMDEIAYKVCLVHQEVAKSEAEKNFVPFAEYVLTSVEQTAKEKLKVVEKKSAAYAEFSKMTIGDMTDFLIAYGKNPGDNAKPDFVKAETAKIVEDTPEDFTNLLKNPNYKMQIFIKKCISKQILYTQGTKFLLPGGDIIGYTLEQTVDYLKNPDNQMVYMQLKAQLESTK